MSKPSEKHIPPIDEDAYRRFIEGLGEANAIFQHMSMRKGARAACIAVRNYIEQGNLLQTLSNPFMCVAEALYDMDRGVEHPLFSADPQSQERSRSVRKKNIICLVGTILEVRFKEGQKLTLAAESIARKVNQWKEIQNQNITGVTVKNWRYEARKTDFLLHDKFLIRVNNLMDLPQGERDSQIKHVLNEGPPDQAII